MWLVARMRETDAPLGRPGQAVQVNVDVLPGRQFDARIENVANAPDPVSRGLTVRAAAEEASESAAVPAGALIHRGAHRCRGHSRCSEKAPPHGATPTSATPPWACSIRSAVDRPRPCPRRCTSRACRWRRKAFFRSVSGTPRPWSATHHRLRARLGQAGAGVLNQTVRGLGYWLEAESASGTQPTG
jgi:hypothetical protein